MGWQNCPLSLGSFKRNKETLWHNPWWTDIVTASETSSRGASSSLIKTARWKRAATRERAEEGRKDQLVDSPKVLLAPLISKHDLTLLPGTEWHREIAEPQWVAVLNNLAQSLLLSTLAYGFKSRKLPAMCVKSQLLHRPVLWVWSTRWKCELDPGPAPFKSILASVHYDSPSSTYCCWNAYSRKIHTIKSLLIFPKVKQTTWYWTSELERWHE